MLENLVPVGIYIDINGDRTTVLNGEEKRQTPYYVPLTRFQIALHVGCAALPDTIDNRASPSGGRQEFAASNFQAQHGGRARRRTDRGFPHGLVKHHVTY